MSNYGRILRPNFVVMAVGFCQNKRNEREKQFLIFCGVLQQYVRTVFCHGLICLISSNSIIHLLEVNLHKGPGIRDHSGKNWHVYQNNSKHLPFRVCTAKECAKMRCHSLQKCGNHSLSSFLRRTTHIFYISEAVREKGGHQANARPVKVTAVNGFIAIQYQLLLYLPGVVPLYFLNVRIK